MSSLPFLSALFSGLHHASLPPPVPFVPQDFEKISEFFKANYKVELTERDMSVKGWNWGTAKFSGKNAIMFRLYFSNI